MNAALIAQKRKTVFMLAGIAAALWLLILALGWSAPSQTDIHAKFGEPVLPGFASARAEIGEIRFTMADDSYTLKRSPNGWVMAESGGYPVRRDRLSELVTGLETLTYGPKRTDDPEKLDRINLGAPETGGTGVQIDLINMQGNQADRLMIGRKGEAIYLRRPDETQTYRTSGNLPPFYNRRSWLDFEIVTIDPSAIRAVRLLDETGESVYLRREAGSDARSFVPAPPYQNDILKSRLAASTTALAIARLGPLDVKPASELTTQPVARHITDTFDDLEIDLFAYREPDGLWVTVSAIEAGEGARRAATINDKADGWAFKLSAYDFQDYTPRVNTLVTRAPEDPAGE